MAIEPTDLMTLILTAIIITAVLFGNHVHAALKGKALAVLYKDAPFYRAHQLLAEAQQQNGNPAEAAVLVLRVEQYLLFNCGNKESDKVAVPNCDYIRMIKAECLIKQEMELLHKTMTDIERVAAYAQHKADVMRFAELHGVTLLDGSEAGFDGISASAPTK